MPGKNHEQLLAVLHSALEEPIGIVIQTNDTVRAKMSLYRCRAAAEDPALAELQIRTSPFADGDLIICHSLKTPQPKASTDLGAVDLQGILDLDD